jgi:hypothetical protein
MIAFICTLPFLQISNYSLELSKDMAQFPSHPKSMDL